MQPGQSFSTMIEGVARPPDGQVTRLGSVPLRVGGEDLGARLLSVNPSTGETSFTAGGIYGSVWIIEGVLARLHAADEDENR